MTTKQALKKVEEMINDDKDYLLQTCQRFLNSGAINKEKYEDNFVLPKIIYYAALQELMFQRKPLAPEHQKEAKNLAHF